MGISQATARPISAAEGRARKKQFLLFNVLVQLFDLRLHDGISSLACGRSHRGSRSSLHRCGKVPNIIDVPQASMRCAAFIFKDRSGSGFTKGGQFGWSACFSMSPMPG
jgi:hypothetical protein